MHTPIPVKHWAHHFHDGTVRVMHYTGHLLHEKAFWAIVALITLLIGMFALLVLFGNDSPMMRNYNIPFSPYY
jgi:hypothetical protein